MLKSVVALVVIGGSSAALSLQDAGLETFTRALASYVALREAASAGIQEGRGPAIRSSIEQSNVSGAVVRVNHRYPPGLPRVTMPGPLLARMPPLPAELEYRFLGQSLLLLDTRANLIVDVLPDVLPR